MNSRVRIEREAFVEVIRVLLQSLSTSQATSTRLGLSNSDSGSLELCLGTKALSGGTWVKLYSGAARSRW